MCTMDVAGEKLVSLNELRLSELTEPYRVVKLNRPDCLPEYAMHLLPVKHVRLVSTIT